MQSRVFSFIESILNVIIGFSINLTAQVVIFPLFGIHIPLKENIEIGLAFTVISITRSYFIRRFFNWFHGRHQTVR